jgi:hypothetical protein
MRNNPSAGVRGCVLPERNMRSHLVIIDGIFRRDSAKVLHIECYQMISAFAPDRPDEHSSNYVRGTEC